MAFVNQEEFWGDRQSLTFSWRPIDQLPDSWGDEKETCWLFWNDEDRSIQIVCPLTDAEMVDDMDRLLKAPETSFTCWQRIPLPRSAERARA